MLSNQRSGTPLTSMALLVITCKLASRAPGIFQTLSQHFQAIRRLVGADHQHRTSIGAGRIHMHVVRLIAQFNAFIRHASQQGKHQPADWQTDLLPRLAASHPEIFGIAIAGWRAKH